MTKICDFPNPLYDLLAYLWPDQKFDTLFMNWYAISYENGGKIA